METIRIRTYSRHGVSSPDQPPWSVGASSKAVQPWICAKWRIHVIEAGRTPGRLRDERAGDQMPDEVRDLARD